MSYFDLEGLVNPVVDCGRSRKRQRNSDNWDKNKRKHARNSSSVHGRPSITCNHFNTESKTCKVRHLDKDDIEDFFNKIYKYKSKVEQDNLLLQFMMPVEPKRRRPRVLDPRSKLLTKYFIRKKNGNLVCVCAKSFSSLTQIGRYRLNGISKSFHLTGEPRVEKRGGSRLKAKDTEIQTSIIQHIQSFKCRESHYGRAKSARVYMGPELSVKKMWRLWKTMRVESSMPTASFSKYYSIFQTRFNIGFGSTKTDVCSFCEQCKIKIKHSKSPREKVELMGQYRLHKLRAKKFYQMLKERPTGSITVAFDMQQNQPLPMIRISETFYSRQIWLYNLTFVIHEDKQNADNTFMYSWTENQSAKGSNEVVSALHNFLAILEERIQSKAEDENLTLPMTLYLYSDATSSQNKNSTMLGYLLNYVQKSKVFNEIQHTFPIRGHSFMPPDRVFGRVEKVYNLGQCRILLHLLSTTTF